MAPTDTADQSLAGRPHDARSPRPRILVLLASRNGASWIGAQLRSILSQRDVELQVVVRDDASIDDTRAEVSRFLSDDRVRLTTGDSPTGSAAQNFFALMRENPPATFDFVALADQDDEWCPDKLSRASQQLRATGSAGYSSATLAIWPNGRSAVLTQSNRSTASDFLFGGIGQGCTFVLTGDFYARARDFLARNGGLTRDIHYHDWALYAIARTWGLPWIFDPKPSVRYRQHGGNDTGAKRTLGGARKRLSLIRNGWYSNQLKTIASLCVAANPSNELIAAWHSTLTAPRTWSRRARVVKFCLHGGRRNATDNCIALFAAAAGWL